MNKQKKNWKKERKKNQKSDSLALKAHSGSSLSVILYFIAHTHVGVCVWVYLVRFVVSTAQFEF